MLSLNYRKEHIWKKSPATPTVIRFSIFSIAKFSRVRSNELRREVSLNIPSLFVSNSFYGNHVFKGCFTVFFLTEIAVLVRLLTVMKITFENIYRIPRVMLLTRAYCPKFYSKLQRKYYQTRGDHLNVV